MTPDEQVSITNILMKHVIAPNLKNTGVGACLITFGYLVDRRISYIGTGNRADMRLALRELLDKWDKEAEATTGVKIPEAVQVGDGYGLALPSEAPAINVNRKADAWNAFDRNNETEKDIVERELGVLVDKWGSERNALIALIVTKLRGGKI